MIFIDGYVEPPEFIVKNCRLQNGVILKKPAVSREDLVARSQVKFTNIKCSTSISTDGRLQNDAGWSPARLDGDRRNSIYTGVEARRNARVERANKQHVSGSEGIWRRKNTHDEIRDEESTAQKVWIER